MHREAGFTLIEVMTAFVIAALASLVLLNAGVNAAAENRAAALLQQAVARAQSRLASFGPLTPLQTETLSGADGGGFYWQINIVKQQAMGPLALYDLSLTERFGGRSVVLTTERLAPAR